jgi:hypothetical protein
MATAPARIAGVYDACVLPAPGIPLLAPTRCSPRTAAVLGQCKPLTSGKLFASAPMPTPMPTPHPYPDPPSDLRGRLCALRFFTGRKGSRVRRGSALPKGNAKE